MQDSTRGQTVIDFAIAMGVFLIAVSFVFTFIPSLTSPFVEGNPDRTVTADRVASHLSEGALGDPADPFVVDDACAEVFFGDTAPIPSDCGYSGGTFYERIGVDGDRLNVNVTIEQINASASGDDRFRTVCVNNSDGLNHTGFGGCATEFVIGATATNRSSVVIASRVVTIPGCDFGNDVESCDATLKVRVW
jgi:hypothetical protein